MWAEEKVNFKTFYRSKRNKETKATFTCSKSKNGNTKTQSGICLKQTVKKSIDVTLVYSLLTFYIFLTISSISMEDFLPNKNFFNLEE